MTEKLKVVLVDDQGLCRRGFSELLAHCYDFIVLGATDNFDELTTLLNQKPDLFIIDLRMKPIDGITMLQQVRKAGYNTTAIMLTMSDSETDLKNAIRAGVRGYLLKDMAPDDVVDAIRRVAAGELVVAPTMTVKMIEMLRDGDTQQEPKNSLKLLTEREREILQLLSRGESNKAIAMNLKISYDTVKQHVRHILNKLNLSSRVKAAVLFTQEQGASNHEPPSSNS